MPVWAMCGIFPNVGEISPHVCLQRVLSAGVAVFVA